MSKAQKLRGGLNDNDNNAANTFAVPVPAAERAITPGIVEEAAALIKTSQADPKDQSAWVALANAVAGVVAGGGDLGEVAPDAPAVPVGPTSVRAAAADALAATREAVIRYRATCIVWAMILTFPVLTVGAIALGSIDWFVAAAAAVGFLTFAWLGTGLAIEFITTLARWHCLARLSVGLAVVSCLFMVSGQMWELAVSTILVFLVADRLFGEIGRVELTKTVTEILLEDTSD